MYVHYQCSKLAGARVHGAPRHSLCAPNVFIWVHAVHPRKDDVVQLFYKNPENRTCFFSFLSNILTEYSNAF